MGNATGKKGAYGAVELPPWDPAGTDTVVRIAGPDPDAEYFEVVEDGKTSRFRKGDPMAVLEFVESCGDASEFVAAVRKGMELSRHYVPDSTHA